MEIYRIQRSERRDGEWYDWYVDKLFSTYKKANQYMISHPMPEFIRQEIIVQEID